MSSRMGMMDVATLPFFDDRERRAIRAAQAARDRDARDERIRREVENVEASVRALRATIDAELKPAANEPGDTDAPLSDAD
jgi:hypothetical protein